MQKRKKQPAWQAHLDQLDHDFSADQHFIREFRAPGIKKLFEPEDDFFNSPLMDSGLADDDEGQLTLDVYQTQDELVIKATLAGVDPKHLDIALDNDVLTIRGERQKQEEVDEADYFYQECYWGRFSRSIVLPTAVNPAKVKAALKNGILTITMPKAHSAKSVKIHVKEIE